MIEFPIFPTNKEPILVQTATETVKLYVVQCFKPDLGFEMLAFVHGVYCTWCLVVETELKSMVEFAFDFDDLLKEVV